MSTHTVNSDSCQNLSNIVSFNGQYWFAYRHNKDVTGEKDLYVAYSPDLKTWRWTKMYDMNLGVSPHTDNRPQLVVSGANLYLFWMDSGEDVLLATRYAPDPKNPGSYKWYPHVRPRNAEGSAIKERGDDANAALGAVASGDRILVSVNHGSSLDTYVFDPATWQSSWKASAESAILPREWDHFDNFKNFGKNQAMTLFSMGGNSTYLVQVVEAINDSGKARWLASVRLLDVVGEHWGPHAAGASHFTWLPGAEKLSVTLDPGGRVVAFYTRDGNLYSRTMTTAATGLGTWSEEKAEPVGFKVQECPVACFTFGDEQPGTTTDRKDKVERAVTRWSLLRRDGSSTTSTVSHDAGLVRKIFQAEKLDLTAQSASPQVYVQGYIDGPPPVFDGMVRPEAQIDYAVSSAVSQSHEVVTNVTVGVKSEGSGAPAVGVGPRWEASFGMTTGAGFGQETTKSISLDTIFQAQPEGESYAQTGLARVASIVLCRDAYEYVEAGAALPVTNGTVCTSIYVDFAKKGVDKIEYRLGTVTVGQLETYTEKAWNTRMAKLYPGRSYIDDVVIPNAVGFQHGEPTIWDTWTPSSPIVAAFGSTAEQYQTSSMTLDASLFAGVTVKFFGADASFMAGFEVVNETTERSAKSESFGVSIDVDGGGGGPVVSYAASTYLLKASKDWVTELVTLQPGGLGGKQIDPNGACWKIMYVVDEIQYRDPLRALDLPAARLAELTARGLSTTQDLLLSLGIGTPAELHPEVAADADPHAADLLRALRSWDAHRNVYRKARSAR